VKALTTFGNQGMIFVESDKIGRLEIGATPGAHSILEMDIDNFGVGTYGVGGFWSTWLNDKSDKFNNAYRAASSLIATASVQSVQFIESPYIGSNYSGNYYSDAPKVNFFTIPVKNMVVALSYIPDLDSHGSIAGMSNYNTVSSTDTRNNPTTFRNIFGAGVSYEHPINKDTSLKVTAVGEAGTSKNSNLHDLRSGEIGAMLSYKNIKIAATAGNGFKTWTLKDNPTPGRKVVAKYLSLGISQSFDNFAYSVTHFRSRKAGGLEPVYQRILENVGAITSIASITDTAENKLQNTVFDVDYTIASGVKIYAGQSFFRFKESNGALDKGYVTMVGTRILF
jgi:hypothetical protein